MFLQCLDFCIPMIFPLTLAALLALIPHATAQTGLNAAAKAAGKKYFGTATDNPELTTTAYVAILDNTQEFGQITAANSMKWVHPSVLLRVI